MSDVSIGIIGGSGLYAMDGLTVLEERPLKTPFGDPSDPFVIGEIDGTRVAFLSRHGRGHRFTPTEVNYRANICALKKLGATHVVSLSAVGSMREEIAPGHVVIVDQYIDMTRRRTSTFFDEGIVAHITFADPISSKLRNILAESARAVGVTVHDGGTYVNMDGPAFSTRAESELNRRHGFDVIGMTNLPEAKLAREAEIALATMAMITDYDCWKVEEEPVSAQTVFGHLTANAETARRVLVEAIPRVPSEPNWPEHTALDSALTTAREFWPEVTIRKLGPILERFR